MAEAKITLKLLVDSKANKVLFAEAGKEFVDFLFHIMSLPVGTIIKLLNVKGMVGSLGALYQSIESLSSDYFQANLDRDTVLKPKVAVNVPLLSLNVSAAPTAMKFYRCNSDENYCLNITDRCGTRCITCCCDMSTELNWIKPESSADIASSAKSTQGYVKGVVTYMVMDNLEVKPMSTISGITLINKFHVTDVSSLMEKEVQMGLKEGLAMLKASLETVDVLTTVFLGKKI